MFWKKNKPQEQKIEKSELRYEQCFEPGGLIGFQYESPPDQLKFITEDTYQIWAYSVAPALYDLTKHKLPEQVRDPRRIGVLSFHTEQGMEGYCHLIVRKFDYLDGNYYDQNTRLLFETEVTVFSFDGQVLFDGAIGQLKERFASRELRFSLYFLKMEKHGLFGLPLSKKEDLP